MSYDLTGKTFNRLTVVRQAPSGGAGAERRWECVCSCGNITVVRSYLLRKGTTKSCGCLRTESKPSPWNIKHDLYNTRVYHTWEGMKQRCLNPNATRYPEYGGVGISVCEAWKNFKAFYEDMGDRPDGMTLDRINPFGNYEKSNCRWATPTQQVHNQRRHYKGSEEVRHALSAS